MPSMIFQDIDVGFGSYPDLGINTEPAPVRLAPVLPAPRSFRPLDVFGSLNAVQPEHSFNWNVLDESKVYRSKDLTSITLPALPADANLKRGFDLSSSASICGLDTSSEEILAKWFLPCLDIRGVARESIVAFPSNSQGMPQLDRYLGKLMLTSENLKHYTFGAQFALYAEWCYGAVCAARGRALFALVSTRLRVDRARGKTMTFVHLLNLPLASYKLSDVRHFTDKVRFCMVHLKEGELKDPDLMFQWLYEKFRGFKPIERKIEIIKEFPLGSAYRQWSYLWNAIVDFLDNCNEDDNLASANAGLGLHTAVLTVTQSKPQGPSSKGKAADTSKGKGKGKGGGKGKSDSDAPKVKFPDGLCRFECYGNCKYGNDCTKSHDPAQAKAQRKALGLVMLPPSKAPSPKQPATPKGRAES